MLSTLKKIIPNKKMTAFYSRVYLYNQFLFPYLIVVAYSLLFIEVFTYEGFIKKYLFILTPQIILVGIILASTFILWGKI